MSVTINTVIGNSNTISGILSKFGVDKFAGLTGKYASEDGFCLVKDGALIKFVDKGQVEYTIPHGVTTIREDVFSGCSHLVSITIPDSVTKIGDCVFKGCVNLTSVTIPDSVTTIEKSVFEGCSSLKNVVIGNRVATIGESVFKGCSSLTDITIPSSVTTIGCDAFHGCSNLTTIKLLATTPPTISNLAISETMLIFVPIEAVKLYKKDSKWSKYAKQIKPIK